MAHATSGVVVDKEKAGVHRGLTGVSVCISGLRSETSARPKMTKPHLPALRLLLVAGCVAASSAQTPEPAPSRNAFRRPPAPSAILASRILAVGDREPDGLLGPAELSAVADAWFNLLEPDGVGVVRAAEFLERFEPIFSTSAPAEAGGRNVTRVGVSMGLFAAVDTNGDQSWGRDELQRSFAMWGDAWDVDSNGLLDETELVDGLESVLPRTNMSGAVGLAQERLKGLPEQPPSPVLAPAEAMETIQLVEGFRLELAASEPMVQDPVALSFDADGRAFVVEMRTFMVDIDGTGERSPQGRIKRLVDTDGDGRFDEATVFVDGLITPRAVLAAGGGVFYVSDYQLWFARDRDGDGVADRTELVDAEYGGGNIEHAPNGLMVAMDNWIYNAKSAQRYRLIGDVLVRQSTEFRGQWGITQDNYGRLLYNVNNSQLLGDYAPPNVMGRNPNHASLAGLNLFVATDQSVFPLRMNTAINRGYSPEVLDPTGRVHVFASSCAPVVYRGDNYPAEFVGDAFVADPAVNLIKRNLMSDAGLTLSARHAYPKSEFLASSDERFRPSNLYNGPDGTLWMVDLYRGIVQYGRFMTAYLRSETLDRGLDQGVHLGRIYRIVSEDRAPAAFLQLSQESSVQLVARLAHPNGWIRDTAQRLLVERGDRAAVPALLAVVRDGESLAQIHALWTLEGLFARAPRAATPVDPAHELTLLPLEADEQLAVMAPSAEVLAACFAAVGDADPKVQVAALRVAGALTIGDPARQTQLLARIAAIMERADDEVLFHAALVAGELVKPAALPVLARLATAGARHVLVRDAVLAGVGGWENALLDTLWADGAWQDRAPGQTAVLQELASSIIRGGETAQITALRSRATGDGWKARALAAGIVAVPIMPGAATGESARELTGAEQALVAEGRRLYDQVCAGCHGADGAGLRPMAPALAGSDWVLGSERRLTRLVLRGVAGPITINGVTHQPPEILPEMPGLAALEDGQIAAILSYLRRTWGHGAEPITPATVATERAATAAQTTAYSAAELIAIE